MSYRFFASMYPLAAAFAVLSLAVSTARKGMKPFGISSPEVAPKTRRIECAGLNPVAPSGSDSRLP